MIIYEKKNSFFRSALALSPIRINCVLMNSVGNFWKNLWIPQSKMSLNQFVLKSNISMKSILIWAKVWIKMKSKKIINLNF
jgi:hypothetical protein